MSSQGFTNVFLFFAHFVRFLDMRLLASDDLLERLTERRRDLTIGLLKSALIFLVKLSSPCAIVLKYQLILILAFSMQYRAIDKMPYYDLAMLERFSFLTL